LYHTKNSKLFFAFILHKSTLIIISKIKEEKEKSE